MGFMNATSAGGMADLVGGIAGLFQSLATVTVFKREVAKLRPRIDQGMAHHKGVLLVVRTETSGFEASVKKILGVCFVGAGNHPAGLIIQWGSSANVWPAPVQGWLGSATVQEEFIWVCRGKDIASISRQPVMTSGSGAKEYKFIPYEQLY